MYRTDEVNLPERTTSAIQPVNGCYEDQTATKGLIRLIQLLEMKRVVKRDRPLYFSRTLIYSCDLESRCIGLEQLSRVVVTSGQ